MLRWTAVHTQRFIVIKQVISSCHVPRVLGGLYQDVVRGGAVVLPEDTTGPVKEDLVGI